MSLTRVANVVGLLQVFVSLSMFMAAGVAFVYGDGDALGFALVIHAILFMPPILISIMVFATWAITGRGNPTRLDPDIAATDSTQAQPPLD